MKKKAPSKASGKAKKSVTRDLSPLTERTSEIKAGRLSKPSLRKRT